MRRCGRRWKGKPVIDKLRTELGVANPDDFYARIIDLHEGLKPEQSHKINAKVILLLANHIGDTEVLNEVLDYISEDVKKHV